MATEFNKYQIIFYSQIFDNQIFEYKYMYFSLNENKSKI